MGVIFWAPEGPPEWSPTPSRQKLTLRAGPGARGRPWEADLGPPGPPKTPKIQKPREQLLVWPEHAQSTTTVLDDTWGSASRGRPNQMPLMCRIHLPTFSVVLEANGAIPPLQERYPAPELSFAHSFSSVGQLWELQDLSLFPVSGLGPEILDFGV